MVRGRRLRRVSRGRTGQLLQAAAPPGQATGRTPVTGPDDELFRDHVFYLRLFYEGPWDRLGLWLLAIVRRTYELKKEVRAGSLRD